MLEGDGFELPVPRSETMISAFAKGKEAARTKGVRLERAAVEGEEVRFARDLYGAFPVKWWFLVFAGSLFGAGKPFFVL
jgi:hypothetical protein